MKQSLHINGKMEKSPSTFFELLETDSDKISETLEDIQNQMHIDCSGANDGALLQLFKVLCGDFWIDPKYLTIEDVIGEGGFGVVEKCRLSLPNEIPKVVALKRLKPEVIHTREDLVEFAEEANLMRKLDCKGLVRLLGVGATNVTSIRKLKETIYVVFEYVGGGTLKEAVYRQMISNGKRYQARDALRWAMQIANAMAYLHSCRPRIIHRDLKLENVLLTAGDVADQKAKVTDLGLHRRMRVDDQLEGSHYGSKQFAGSVHRGSVLARASSMYQRSQKSRVKVPEGDVAERILNESSRHSSARSALMQAPVIHKSPSQEIIGKQNLGKESPTQNKLASFFQSQELQQVQKDEEDSESKDPIVINDATRKVGSFMYMSPEVYVGHSYNEKVDVFSFGVILYEMFTGKLNVVKIAVTHDEDKVRQYAEDVSEGYREQIPSGWPKDLRKMVEECWSQEYSRRPSFEDLVLRLDNIYLTADIDQIDRLRPRPGYSPTNDIGCCCPMQ